MRLQKYLADQGIASRRKAESLIKGGSVKVNGVIAVIGQKVDPDKDEVVVSGQDLSVKSAEKVVFAFNKPKGVTATNRRFKGERNITSYLPKEYRLFPAGRLDKDSRGLMILTNDGELSYELTHPSNKVEREYHVKARRELSDLDLKRIRKGINYDKEFYEVISIREKGPKTYRIVLREGNKRHIRTLFKALHNEVVDLYCRRVGQYEIGHLPSGKYKKLNEKEIEELVG